MKRITASLVFIFAVMTANAQDLGQFTFDGFVRTGFLWEKNERIGQPAETKMSLRSLNDDAGTGHGRIRMNFGYAINNVGIKGRIQWDNWQIERKSPDWPYLFGYINAFQDQFTMSLGKLGASPWGTGGPEKYKELESVSDGSGGGGVRFEYKPLFAPGLNVGFVLNWYNGSTDRGINRDVTLLDLLQETVFGIAYEHEYFLVHFEYRLDSEIDQRPGSGNQSGGAKEGDDLIYRLEERVLKNYLPDFKIWALGVYQGVGADDIYLRFENWFFAEYAPEWGTAQIRLGYDVVSATSILHVKPSYYHNFFDKLIQVGASFYLANDFGDNRINKDAPYTEMRITPKLQVNFPGIVNAYAVFEYEFKQIYKQPQPNNIPNPPIERFQTMNLRFGMAF